MAYDCGLSPSMRLLEREAGKRVQNLMNVPRSDGGLSKRAVREKGN